MALGAGRENILRLVLREGLSLALAGIAIGLVCALAATRVLRTLVESVEPGDPLALASVTLSLLVVALAASYVPARRASKVDPIVALRHE
jgi:ABC-type antimicrobial peptide transport system permease subunit